MTHQKSSGLTLVEMLIGVAVLGVVLTIGTYFFSSTASITNRQDQLATVANDARLALFRMSEVVRQAGYVYPPGVSITVAGSGTFTTGQGVLALLVPAGTTYCMVSGSVYCGFLYYVGNRSAFVPPLSASSGFTGQALGEIRVTGIQWAKSAVPALTIRNWPAGDLGLLSDDVSGANTNLGNDVRISGLEAIYDDAMQFHYAASPLSARSLLNGVNMTLTVQRNALGGEAGSTQSLEVFTRSVPRSAPVNLD